MDFFAHQDAARRNTTKLIVLFVLAVIGMVIGIYVIAILLLQGAEANDQVGWWNGDILGLAGGGTLLIVGIGSLYKTAQLRRGGPAVAQMLGGRELAPNSQDVDERRLINIVEEVAVASGVPVPTVYLLDNEAAINAFAAGLAPGDAVVGVTRGCLEQLNRDELQGVIAHEFSHILNGDMRLNLRIIGVLHGILCISLAGYLLLRSTFYGGFRRRDSKGNAAAAIPIIGIGLIVIGSVGLFFSRLIQAAVSRQREFLADAAAVQFTRNPAGIAGALKKIGGLASGAKLATAQANATSHLFFGNALSAPMLNLLATHPPLPERIRRIEPAFRAETKEPRRRQVDVSAPLAPGFTGATANQAPAGLTPDRLVEQVGQPTDRHLDATRDFLAGLPLAVNIAVHEPFSARALIFAMLLSPSARERRHQLNLLRQQIDDATTAETLALASAVTDLDRAAYLAIVDLAMPALREMSARQHATFLRAAGTLVSADDRIDLWEFTLSKVLERHLSTHFAPPARPKATIHRLPQLLGEARVLLSCLAHAGHADADAIRDAFDFGIRSLPTDGYPHALLDTGDVSLTALGRALDRIQNATPGCKKAVLRACAKTVAHDGVVLTSEAELLRAIADTLDCPMPPLLKEQEEVVAGSP
ncbi:MAG: M48 family metallopeptidase [Planctomycetota bacterium]